MPLINFTMGLLAIVAAVFIYLEVVTVLVDVASPVVFTTELKSWNPFVNPVLKVLMIIGIFVWFKYAPQFWTHLILQLRRRMCFSPYPFMQFKISRLAPAVFCLMELIRLKKRIFG